MPRIFKIIVAAICLSLFLNVATLGAVLVVNARGADRTCQSSHAFRTGMQSALLTIADKSRDPNGARQLLAPLLEGPLAPHPC